MYFLCIRKFGHCSFIASYFPVRFDLLFSRKPLWWRPAFRAVCIEWVSFALARDIAEYYYVTLLQLQVVYSSHFEEPTKGVASISARSLLLSISIISVLSESTVYTGRVKLILIKCIDDSGENFHPPHKEQMWRENCVHVLPSECFLWLVTLVMEIT